jgi:cytoskeletal protein CcmA (bactofilin family)
MVWPLKKRSLPPPMAAGFSLDDSRTAPQNVDTIQAPVIAQETLPAGTYTVPRGYKVSGAISTSRPVVIAGEITGGSLTANSVVVCRGGFLGAPSAVNSIVVEGEVGAPLSAREGIDVRPGGVVRGPVETPALRVAAGGVIASAQVAVGS